MPCYLLDVEVKGTLEDGGQGLTSRRFPELVVEHRFVEHDATGHEVWVVRAPSAAHVERWVSASCSAVRSVQQIHEGGPVRQEEASR
jgi:hypothetical protein